MNTERTDRNRLIGLVAGFLFSCIIWLALIVGAPALVFLVVGR